MKEGKRKRRRERERERREGWGKRGGYEERLYMNYAE